MAVRSSGRGAAALYWGLGMGVLTVVVLRRTLVVVTVRGVSMEPAFRDGERVLVRRGGRYAVGRVVVVERVVERGGERDVRRRPAPPTVEAAVPAEREWIIKRVAAVAGDPLPPGVPASSAADGGRVPPGALVLIGDNAHNSYDSRQAGFFPAARVLGTVLRTRRADHRRYRLVPALSRLLRN
ncbi:S26 family signal peptidase [Streptomyces olivoreticuli]